VVERQQFVSLNRLHGLIGQEGTVMSKGQSFVVTAVLVLFAIVGFALQG